MSTIKQKTLFLFSSKFLISYLYLLQGIIIGLPSSITLTYQQLPNYQILGIFAASTFPYSFKFLLAPFIQKYTSYKYGRRKTWVVISTILAAFFMFILSYYTSSYYQKQAAFILFIIQLLIAIQDISVDALALKQLDSPQQMTYFQMFMMQIGFVISGMIFLELVLPNSVVFNHFGYYGSVLTVSTYCRIISLFMFIPIIISHFTFHQSYTPEELNHQKQIKQQSLWSVIKRYKYFILPRYRSCRQALVFILYPHGAGYFSAAFHVQLVKSYGFIKQNLSFLFNIGMIQTIATTYFLTKYIENSDKQSQFSSNSNTFLTQITRLHNYSHKIYIIRLILGIIAIFFISQLSKSFILSCLFILIIRAFFSIQTFNDITLVSNHGAVAFYGAMSSTMFSSVRNLGGNTSIQLQIIDKIGYQYGGAFGLIWMIIWIIFFQRVGKWIREGQIQNFFDQQKFKQK